MTEQVVVDGASRSESAFWSRVGSILIFILGLCTFLGVDAYQDFYWDLKTKLDGRRLDVRVLSDFCGWTRGKYPQESDLAYGLRASWNMGSAMLAMVSLSTVVFGILFGGLFWLFRRFGAFDSRPVPRPQKASRGRKVRGVT